MNQEAPIGVFDSGLGGLTVVKEIMRQLPEEAICYFGDTARVPYGSKSKETVIKYSRQIVKFLMTKEVKAIVVACNTASALALETIKQEIDIPILGVVKPGAKAAAAKTRTGNVGIIATEATISSGKYQNYFKEQYPQVNVYGKACPLLVPLVEEGILNDPITVEMVKRYTKDLLQYDIDTLVLGCTHYPLLSNVIQEVVGNKIMLVNPAQETAKALQETLQETGLYSTKRQTDYCFYVSDGAERFQQFADRFLPCRNMEALQIDIEQY